MMPTPRLREIEFTPIETERLLIRVADAGDVDSLHDMLSRPEVCRYLLHPPLSVGEVVERWLASPVAPYSAATAT